jgi:antitoxin VapB
MRAVRAKLFQNGGSQAVRLPKDYRFAAQSEVMVRREGRRVVLEPLDEWPAEFLACLGAWPGEIPRGQGGVAARLRARRPSEIYCCCLS